jgi:hypothetical protein
MNFDLDLLAIFLLQLSLIAPTPSKAVMNSDNSDNSNITYLLSRKPTKSEKAKERNAFQEFKTTTIKLLTQTNDIKLDESTLATQKQQSLSEIAPQLDIAVEKYVEAVKPYETSPKINKIRSDWRAIIQRSTTCNTSPGSPYRCAE